MAEGETSAVACVVDNIVNDEDVDVDVCDDTNTQNCVDKAASSANPPTSASATTDTKPSTTDVAVTPKDKTETSYSFPLARVRRVMKLDPEVKQISHEAAAALTRATV